MAPTTWKSISNNVVKVMKKKRYDPVELLPTNVVDKIFDSFNGKELMEMSLVNRRWYHYLGKSDKHMDKVEIRIIEPKSGHRRLFSMRDARLISNNGRKYFHISMIGLEFGLQTQHKFLLTRFHWHTVKLARHIFKSQIMLNNFLGIIEPFVKELKLRTVCVTRVIPDTLEQNFTFPKLQKLSIRSCSAYLFKEPFNGVNSLNCLRIGTETASKYSPGRNNATLRCQGIQNIFLNNNNINVLEMFLSQEDFDAIFMDERFLRNIQFLVSKLYVGCFLQEEDDGNNIVQIQNFIRFLESQKLSLLQLKLEKWLGISVLQCAVNDLNLQGLTISTFEHFGRHNDNPQDLILHRNQTIEHLKIWTDNNRILRDIVEVCHNLKVLDVTFITQNIFDTIIKNCPNLEVIKCNSFTASRPPIGTVLNNLRHLEINVTLSKDFRDQIMYRAWQTNFDRIFLKASFKLQSQLNYELMTNTYRRQSY